MSKTTPAPRVRQTNLYTVESDGQPVAQAMAISQAEAVRLYVESVQQPTMTARLSSPLEARTLAGLPLLQREPAAVDTSTADMFEATPAADHVEDILAMVEPLAAGGFAPCGRALGDRGKATQTCGRDGCGVELAEMPPQHAPIAAVLAGLPLLSRDAPESPATSACTTKVKCDGDHGGPPCGDPGCWNDDQQDVAVPAAPDRIEGAAAETPAVCQRVMQDGQACGLPPGCPDCGSSLVDYPEPVALEVAAAPQGELVPSAPSTAAPTVSHAPAADEQLGADEPTKAERMASAYAAGVEIARQGHTRWSAEFLDANASALRGLRDAAADEVHAEMLRGFDDGKAQAEPAGTQERRRQPDEAPKGAGKVPVKYRNPATGESWSGRGLRPRWVVLAMDEGKALEDFLI